MGRVNPVGAPPRGIPAAEPAHWKAVVPAVKHAAVARGFEGVFGDCPIEGIAALPGGLSSALVYKVTSMGRAFVLRLVVEMDAQPGQLRHFSCMNAASAAGIAPPVRYTNADDGVSIMDFIASTPMAAGFADEAELHRVLAVQIKAIHALPLFPPLVDLMDGVDDMMVRYRSWNLLPPAATAEHFELYAAVQSSYPRHLADLVSSHNDLNPGNLLYREGRIWVIDWEAAFANDRYADLAIVNLMFGAAERAEDVLLQTYFGAALTPYHRARFYLMQQIIFMYYAMILMQLVAQSRPDGADLNPSMETIGLRDFCLALHDGAIDLAAPATQLHYAKVLLNEMLLQMKSARFGEAIAVVAGA